MNLNINILVLLLLLPVSHFLTPEAEKKVDAQAIHPRYREWVTPTDGRQVEVNPPALLWPVADKSHSYAVRLSQDKHFPDGQTIASGLINRAEFTAHHLLQPGKWYWQYATFTSTGDTTWSATYDFTVGKEAREFATPAIPELLSIIKSTSHPRLYVNSGELAAFREKNRENPEVKKLLHWTGKNLGMAVIPEAPTRPRDTTGLSPFEKKVIMRFMYHQFGDKVRKPVYNFCLAYLLTGEEKYIRAAIPHTLHIAAMDPEGWATQEDFNRASVMLALAEAYDTGYEFFTPGERAEILAAIKVRGDYFYKQYAKEFETHSMDNHVWQHTLRRWMFTSIAVLGDIPEAAEWLAYCYETWCCRFPILGGNDGGWHDGSSYFQVNFETFIYVPFILSRLTGVNFFDIPWYHNLPSFLIYSFPKDSYSTGFGDGYEKMETPNKKYISFADALARELNNGYARWYTDQLIGQDFKKLYADETFTLYRLLTQVKYEDVKPVSPAREPQSKLFRDAGFALMHTNVSNAASDLMATFMSLPFGATGHAHASHNGFTINLGGKELYGGSGHYSNFNDAHTLMHYRTRGHNVILADNLSPVIGENGYGWIARFADTGPFSYALGDATHAFGQMTTPFWIDRMQQSEVEYTRENGFGDPGITRWRRHFVLLRPDIIVVYDELAAKQAVNWTWLLHSYNQLEAGENPTSLFTSNVAGTSRFDLFTPTVTNTYISNEFFSPAINWKARTGADGKPLTYEKHWHASFETQEKSGAIRFLGIFQIRQGHRKDLFIRPEMKNGSLSIGNWRIEAELRADKPASLVIRDKNGNAIIYNKDNAAVGKRNIRPSIQGSTAIVTEGKLQEELIDIAPELK